MNEYVNNVFPYFSVAMVNTSLSHGQFSVPILAVTRVTGRNTPRTDHQSATGRTPFTHTPQRHFGDSTQSTVHVFGLQGEARDNLHRQKGMWARTGNPRVAMLTFQRLLPSEGFYGPEVKRRDQLNLNAGHSQSRNQSFKLIYPELKVHMKIFETRSTLSTPTPLSLSACPDVSPVS